MSFMQTKREGETQLLKLFRELSEGDRKTLLDLGEFLLSREVAEDSDEIAAPTHIARPASESVVAAIKRLSESYSMLDKSTVLNETSSLMAQHIMQGRSAPDVIDELERVFREKYEKLTACRS